MNRRSFWRGGILIGLLLLAGSAWADYKSDYQDGVAAFEKGNWAEARRLMNAALAANPTPAARMRTYGTNFIPYVPYYYLGLASAQMGDCAGAVQALKDSGSRGVVNKMPELAKALTQTESRCAGLLAQADSGKPPASEAKPPVTPPVVVADTKPVVVDVQPDAGTPPGTPTTTRTAPVQPATPSTTTVALSDQRMAPTRAALTRVDAQIGGIQRQLQAQPLAGSGDARVLGAQLEQLLRQRQQLSADLERARVAGNAGQLASIDAGASSLARDLGMLADRANSAVAGLAQAQEASALKKAQQRAVAALSGLDQSLVSARAAGVSASATKSADDLRVQLTQAGTSTDRAAIERLLATTAGAVKQLDTAVAAAPKPAPESLRALAALYLGGKYPEAAAWNDLERLPDARSRAQARLLRAAARWRLYVRGGEQDGSLIAAVDSDLREAKRLDRALKPNPQAFSPKLVDRLATL